MKNYIVNRNEASGPVEVERLIKKGGIKIHRFLLLTLFILGIAFYAEGKTPKEEFPVPHPPFSEGIFP
jgi:hypothetical protein